MNQKALEVDRIPELREPLFIAGFDGWGNALDISRGMADYLIRKLDGKVIARFNPDFFYRFDENRPRVDIANGVLKSVSTPACRLYAANRAKVGRDMVILVGNEPNLRWVEFVETLLTFCKGSGVKTIISLGSMYDSVLHTDTVISAMTSSTALLTTLKEEKVIAVNYKGPSAIHALIQSEAQKQAFDCMSLWCHCPYYLQGTTHFGLMCRLGEVLGAVGGFDLETSELEESWKDLIKQIQSIIDKNPELQGMISELKKEKYKASLSPEAKNGKVIRLEDFLKPR